jgi:ppGpp synthetase/RelA/SpoT-type nucleotidyltranferase|tara:strand:- start:889 stop:1368 length:480 start_codon:yes stop_codon:yes gene_type:complete
MVDGEIDPRSVEAMEKFKNYSKEAQQNMQSLQQQMDKFTNSMSMTKGHTQDLTEALRNIGNTQPFQQMEESIKEVQSGLEQTMNRTQSPVNNMNREPINTATQATSAPDITVNLRIDVSGVTDKTDKKTLAKEISNMVTKELRSKMGGSLTQSGFNRSG